MSINHMHPGSLALLKSNILFDAKELHFNDLTGGPNIKFLAAKYD